MDQKSSRVTRRQTRSQQNASDDDSEGNQDRSHSSTRSWHDDSLYSSFSIHDSKIDSSFNDRDKTAQSSFSNSPNKSSLSPIRLYPVLPHELNESGDSSLTERKKTKIYPDLPPSPASKSIPRSESKVPNENGNASLSQHKILILVILIVGGLVLIYLNMNTTEVSADSNLKRSKSGFEFFEDEIESLKDSFPNQTQRFWSTLSASALHVFEQTDPCYPSVILMASHNKHQQLSSCLAKKIAYVFSQSFDRHSQISTIGTDVEDFKHMNANEQKLYLDEAMQKTFHQEGGKAFVISNIHSLSPQAALLLHGFCDGDNAPFKDVMIILTFQVDESVVFKSVKQVESLLTEIWSKGLDMDKLFALMSRVANNPVVLMAENESTVNKHCS